MAAEELDRVRAFVAIPFPAVVRERLVAVATTVARQVATVRPTPVDNLHLTVRFLGDLPAAEVSPIAHAVLGATAEGAPCG